MEENKKKVNEKFGRKMNQGVSGNMKLFRKEVNKMNRCKVENYSRTEDRNGRMALGYDLEGSF